MNYETVILEMLTRIKQLEEEVQAIKSRFDEKNEEIGGAEEVDCITQTCEGKKITTADIRKYIESIIETAKENGKEYVVIVARDINNDLQLKRRYPMVCNAMKQCMRDKDVVVFAPQSGYSSTLEIKYYL